MEQKKTGGICGSNEGSITNCLNRGGINATAETVKEADEGEESTTNFSFSMDLTQTATDEEKITSAGGIAGINSGLIQSCTNHGAIGYPHVGYRMGGIAGYQRGCIDGCINHGKVQGRKDIGGIAGLFEPYVEINYEEGTSKKLRGQMDDLIDMLSELSDITRNADENTIDNMDHVGESIDGIKDSIDDYKKHYQDKNDAFIDDMEEALDIVERRIDMLDFDINDKLVTDAVSGMEKDLREAQVLLEMLKMMQTGSGTANGASIMSVEADNTAKNPVNGQAADENTDNENATDENTADESTSDESDSESHRTDTSVSGNDTGDTVASMDINVFRAAGSGLSAMLPDSVKQAMQQLGISEEELMEALIEQGFDPTTFDPTDPAQVAQLQAMVVQVLQEAARQKVLGITQDMGRQSGKLGEAAKDAVGEGKSFVDNADKLGTEVKHVIHVAENYVKDLRDDLRETDEDLSSQMDELDEKIDALKDDLRGANDDVMDQMDRITDQMHLINNTASDGMDKLEDKLNDTGEDKKLEDYYDDLSDSDDRTQISGKVMGCRNEGPIISDINGGGIAGALSVDLLEGESEFAIEKKGSFSLDAERKAIGTILDCKNNNEVAVKNDYAGGIVGRADLGAVIACENYGDVTTVDGDYAGGIAGRSGYMIRNSYTLCNIAGNNYAGGIAGEGSSIKDSYAMTSIDSDEGEKYGAIAGDVDEDGVLSGNYFVEEGIAAVNGLTYSGQAAPLSYEELIAKEQTPLDFRHFTIRFMVGDEVIKTVTCEYEESLKENEIPETPAQDGILGSWDKTDFTNIRRNMIVRAVYGDWKTALASEGSTPEVLISGQFLPNAILYCERLENEEVPQPAGYQVQAAYRYSIEDGSVQGEDTFGVHVLTENYRGKICAAVLQDGKLKFVDGKQDGRYYVFRINSEKDGEFVVFTQEVNWKAIACVAAVAVVVLILIVILVRGRRKKTAEKAAQAEKPVEEKSVKEKPVKEKLEEEKEVEETKTVEEAEK